MDPVLCCLVPYVNDRHVTSQLEVQMPGGVCFSESATVFPLGFELGFGHVCYVSGDWGVVTEQ